MELVPSNAACRSAKFTPTTQPHKIHSRLRGSRKFLLRHTVHQLTAAENQTPRAGTQHKKERRTHLSWTAEMHGPYLGPHVMYKVHATSFYFCLSLESQGPY